MECLYEHCLMVKNVIGNGYYTLPVKEVFFVSCTNCLEVIDQKKIHLYAVDLINGKKVKELLNMKIVWITEKCNYNMAIKGKFNFFN